MIFLMRKKKLDALLKEAVETGLNLGYNIGWKMREVDNSNRGIILGGTNVDREVDQILKNKGVI